MVIRDANEARARSTGEMGSQSWKDWGVNIPEHRTMGNGLIMSTIITAE